MKEKAEEGRCVFLLQLCDFAQEWADELARSNSFKHRSNSKYGENLYTEWSSKPRTDEVIRHGECKLSMMCICTAALTACSIVVQ